jgi:hypothetical protein
MQCAECGSELNDNATMCAACGAQVTRGSEKLARAERGFLHRFLEPALFTAAVAVLVGGSALIALLATVGANAPWTARLGNVTLFQFPPHLPAYYSDKPLDHANEYVTLLMLVMVSAIVITIISAQRGRLPFIRRIPGLNAIDEAVGRATEMGRPILFSTGLHGIDIPTLQALAVATHVAKHAVRYGTRLIMPVCDPQMMPITEEVIREVYTAEGRPEAFKSEDIRYLSDRQFAYAAGVTGILHREKVAASFLFGAFFAEALILAENGQAVGAIQVAGTPELTQIPFFVVTCDYTIIGDEYYAATAYLSREPTQLGSLVGQDISKGLLLLIIVAGVVWSIFQLDNPLKAMLGG